MNVVLIGYRGSGKSTVGKALADKLGRTFVDCDDYIEEKTRKTIREIFEKDGETRFRAIESEAIVELAKLEGRVIATGGGAALKYKNVQALKRNGTIVFLEVAPDTAYQRLKGDASTPSRRPALTDQDLYSEVRKQIESRLPYYRAAADLTVDTDGKRVEDIVGELLDRLKKRGFEERQDQDEALA